MRLTFALNVRQGLARPSASEIESDLNVSLAFSHAVVLCGITPAFDVVLLFLSTSDC